MPRALIVKENKKLAIEQVDVSRCRAISKKILISYLYLPNCGPRDLLIRVTHSAQNPIDWKLYEFGFAKPGSVVGCDFAGEVVEVGAEASGNFTKFERVAGCVHGGLDPECGIRGSYSEYIVQDASLVFRYPASIPAQSAATIPLSCITAALGLFHEMNLSLPPAKSDANVLVWAGSTSVGQYAIQLAKAAGCFVVTTASPARNEYLKQLGADVCFDYRDEDVVSKIKKAASGDISYAIDCFSEQGSTTKTCAALSGSNPQVSTVLPGVAGEVPSHVKQHPIMMFTIFGTKINIFGQDYEAKPQDKKFAEKFYKLLTDVLLPEGLVKPNKATILPGGLGGVEDGFKRMIDKKVAAEKLVYVLSETV